MRCVVCGKELRKVTSRHVELHDHDLESYRKLEAKLPAEAWELYWTHPQLQRLFTNPTTGRKKKTGVANFKTYLASPKVQRKHPELKAALSV